MPNWCNNTITIEHKDSAKINEVVKSLTTKINDDTNESLFFGFCKPEPDYKTTPVAQTYPEIREQFAKTKEEKAIARENKPTIRKDSWWDWRVQNWGTKWNIEVLEKEDLHTDKNGITFDCQTAWSPPIEALVELENKGFKIECDYYEGGCAFIGRYSTGTGVIDWRLPETLAELEDMMKDNKVFKDLVESWGVDLDYEEMEREDD